MNARIKKYVRVFTTAAIYAGLTAVFETSFGSRSSKKGKK